MKGAITQNFRGQRALVIHADDPNRRMLVGVLGRLGLEVGTRDPAGLTDIVLPDADLILVDADEGLEALSQHDAVPAVPCIALIGNEAPSRLARVVRQRCASHILKPIRSSGVFTAVLLAVNEHARRVRADREIDTLRQRLAGRRIVTKAVLHLMALDGIDADAAYERLRVAAMNRRVPIDEMARESLSRDGACPLGGLPRTRSITNGP